MYRHVVAPIAQVKCCTNRSGKVIYQILLFDEATGHTQKFWSGDET